MCSLGIDPTTFALLTQCSNYWATGTVFLSEIHRNAIVDQIKSLLLSHHHSTSALVSEILMSVLQTVQKEQQTIYIWTDSAKKTALEHLQCSRQCKKNNNNNLHMDRQCKKNNNNNLHMDRQCLLQHCICVSRPCEILGDVNAEELKAGHPLHRCLVDGDGCVFSALSPVIHHQLLGLVDVEWEVVLLTPFSLGVDRYVFFRADTDTDYYRSSKPIFWTDIRVWCKNENECQN